MSWEGEPCEGVEGRGLANRSATAWVLCESFALCPQAFLSGRPHVALHSHS